MWRKVVDGIENNKQAAWMNQTPAVILNIQRQPGANTISVVKAIKAILPQLEVNLPAGDSGDAAHRSDHRDQRLGRRRRV
jgi:multidrug efflux pump subunit AcrB